MKFDLLLKGGHVIDSVQGIDSVKDVAFAGGRVAAVGRDLSEEDAQTTIDADDRLVIPGFVDIHAHFYYGVASLCRDPRKEFLPTGVTCAVEGGTAGAANYYNLRDFIIESSEIKLYAFLNIEVLGLLAARYVRTRAIDMALVENAVEVIERNKATIIGTKVILPSEGSSDVDTSQDLLDRAVDIANRTNTKILCHIDGGLDIETLLARLRPGDIITHCFQGKQPNFIGSDGKVRAAVWDARRRGVVFDLGAAGTHHFDWRVAEAAAREGLFPDTISTDYAVLPKGDPMYTMAECVSMMMRAGMALADAIAAATTGPASAIGKADRHGSLRPGVWGEAVILERERATFEYRGMFEQTRTVGERLVPITTINRGVVAWTRAADVTPGGLSA